VRPYFVADHRDLTPLGLGVRRPRRPCRPAAPCEYFIDAYLGGDALRSGLTFAGQHDQPCAELFERADRFRSRLPRRVGDRDDGDGVAALRFWSSWS
jgi:hypothetical protein